MMVSGVWYSIDEALPPLDDEYQSIEVIVILKSGAVGKGFRYCFPSKEYWVFYMGADSCFKDIETLGDDDVAGWSLLPPFVSEEKI